MTTQQRPFNFGPGPATLPAEVLQQAADELPNWHGSGMSVMEMSHRGPEFIAIYEHAVSGLRTLLDVPPDFHILFLQGGGIGENAIAPLNLSQGGVLDFILTGSWSRKSYEEAGRYASAARIAANGKASGHTGIPPAASWNISPDAAYVHLCSNETIQGVQFQELPDLAALGADVPLVVDCSSDIASRRFDWRRIGMAFAGAQKNLGPAGLTLVFVREALLGRALPICPSAFNYELVARNQSMYNTPPTWGIYLVGLMVDWMLRQREGDLSGLAALEVRNQRQAAKLYAALDASDFYINRVDPAVRSWMNVPFTLADARRDEAFLDGASRRGLLQLRGHNSVGGMRASLYNAMTDEGVDALIAYLQDFERRQA
ncbi:3-phosphoserine/phosphohydroxythreonine transaminase [Kerstersia gyiorum]|uniref:3-phosphoserine/phosphohydroxythreonine transaminase n=1 Tax=Kerstersia gyiorum TaxID=206506 RepID=UPI0020A04972|nr:3-phosphoserine/phosphohydroxythreonine transaminase [Kerstersia gyiorum]MCP1632297.1 phosphoserine aminotransferase [Kerstersia gyiorum]MCP1635196.1 phosphoserine aminotransferase [Kerstersia gyiorum]MCP1669877.1 phosphoserine aminotransferase [Kerstersia gyiorum]MCP1678016.1 phosphoserine aminotransferase [Kerstersia gyiorum]MCP1680981.1 phosphoserine aminotransferase [Kerstersia gyiorum]